ncbi:MAG: MBL fold metallo-hydrolase, partial [Sciscionella sp.]
MGTAVRLGGVDTEYTGHVEPGGAAATRDLDAIRITKLSVGPMDNNAYLLVDRASNEALLIDAANDPQRLSDLVGNDDARPALRTIVTTHQHADHWQALGATAGAFGTNTIAHELDAAPLPVPPDFFVDDGDTITFGSAQLEVIHLRGHTPGSIALLYREPSGR